MTKNSELQKSSHVFWRKEKGGLLCKSVKKHIHPPRGWKVQLVRVLQGKAGVTTDGERILVLLHIEGGGY